MKNKIISLFIVFLMVSTTLGCLDSKSAEEYFYEGVYYFNQQDYKNAISLFDKALKIDSTYKEAWYYRGITIEKSNLLDPFSEGLYSYERAIAIDPHYDDALVGKGRIYISSSRYDDAIELFEKVLESNPNHAKAKEGLANAWYYKGFIYYQQERYQEALICYDKVVEFDPNLDSWGWNALKFKSMILKKIEDPNHPQTWVNKGDALVWLDRYAEALQDYERAIAIDPNYKQAWLGKGNALVWLDRHTEALQAYDRSIQIDPNCDIVWHNKGYALDGLGRYTEALQAYDRSIQIDPNCDIVWHNKGNTLYNLGRYNEALKAYDRALEIDPNDPITWITKSETLFMLGRISEALEAFERAIELGYKE